MTPNLSLELYPVLKRAGSRTLRQLDVEFALPSHQPSVELTANSGGKLLAVATAPGTAGRNRATLWLPEPDRSIVVAVALKSAGKVLSGASLKVAPCRRWSLHLLHHSHFDLGYTTLQPNVLELQIKNFDTALDYIEKYRTQADDNRFRWNVECTFPLLNYLNSRPEICRQRLLQAAHDGLLEVTAMPFTLQSEGCTMEELIKSLQPVHHLRQMGFAIQTAVQSDVPGVSALLPQLLNSINVRHLAMAPNNFRAPFHGKTHQELPRPFIWEGPGGGELFTWFTDLYDHVYQEGNILGFLESIETLETRIGPRLSGLETSGFPWRTLGLRTQGSYSDNGRPNSKIVEIVEEWNRHYAAPRIRMSTFHQFFTEIEAEAKGRLKRIRAFWPDWWNEGIGSMAREFAMHRRSQEKAMFSETALALASGHKIPMESRRVLDSLWQNILLCDEHTWGAATPEDNAEEGPRSGELQSGFKKSFFFQGALAAERAENAAGAFWAMTSPGSDTPRIVVQNALSWLRSGLVELDREELQALLPGSTNWKFIDAESDQVLVCQSMDRGNAKTVHLFVENVPGFGQRTVTVHPESQSEQVVSIPHTERRDIWRGRLSNADSALESCPRSGGILYWAAQDGGMVLADDSSPFLLGGIIHQKYARRHIYFLCQEITATHTEENASIESLEEGRLFTRLTICSQCGPTKVRREEVLHHVTSRIDIITSLQKPSTQEAEAVFMALPLAISGAKCILGTNAGPMIPGQNQIPGSSSDWFVLRDHLDVAGPTGGVMIALPDTPMIQLGDIRKPSPRGTAKDPRHLFLYVLNNLWTTNFAASQGGDFTFRAALMNYSHPYDAAWSRRRALECISPLRAFTLGAGAKAGGKEEIPPLQIQSSENVMASLHQTDRGVEIRLEEIGGKSEQLRITFADWDVKRAQLTNIIGESIRDVPLKRGTIKLQLKPREIASLRLDLVER